MKPRAPLSIRLLAAAGLFAGVGLGLAQQPPPPAPEPIPLPPGSVTEAEAVAEQVQAGRDEFLTELYDEEIHGQLDALKKALQHRPLPPEALAPFVAPEFRGTPLEPLRRLPLRQEPPSVARYEPDPSLRVTAASLPEEFERWLADWAAVSSIEFKTTAISIEQDDPPRVRLQIRYNFVGQTSRGQVRQLTGHWMTQWRKDPEQGWLWLSLAGEEGWESRTPRPHFTDVTACALGDSPAYDQLLRGLDWYSAHLDQAFNTGIASLIGMAVADIDGDGDEDFYLCQPSGLPNRLFRAEADGRYVEITPQAGVDALDHSSGAVFFDYDNDGDPDLLLTGRNALLLFQNDGRGRFTRLDSKQAGLSPATDKKAAFYSACITDYNRDGWLDVYVCSYKWRADEGGNPNPYSFYDATNGAPNFLFRNNGDGTFTEVTEETGLDHNNNRYSLACAWADYNRDGWPDLYVANDFGRNSLYRANGDGTFTDVAAELGVEDMAFGMSVDWGDYDNDGWLDIYVANMWSSAGLRTTMQPVFKPGSDPAQRAIFRRLAEGNSLFRNRGDGTFEEVTAQAGVAFGRWSWSSQFFDFDLDGHQDLFIRNGYITNESTRDL